MNNSIFYNLEKDLSDYPEAIIYCILGGRNTGKTFSTLKYLYEKQIKFVFIKRTNNDVDLLCVGAELKKKKNIEVDLSPFKPLNEEYGWNIKPVKLLDGIGAFYECDEEGNPSGAPIGWIVSLHAIGKVKGFSMSECDVIVFDEFVPLPYERIDRKEDQELLDFYKTVQRAKFLQGKRQIMILLANAADITCPVLVGLDLVNDIADMQINDVSINYIEDRLILIHRLNDNPAFYELESQNPIYKVMKGTAWARMSLDNEFAYSDFTNVKKKNLKMHIPVVGCIYKNHCWYVYQRDGNYHMCITPNSQCEMFDLSRENDQKRFYNEYVWDLRDICIENRMTFQSFQMYDLIVNYRKIFEV